MGAPPTSTTSLNLRIFAQQQLSVLPAVIPMVYLLGILYELEDEQIIALAVRWIPWILAVLVLAAPLALIGLLSGRALRRSPDDAPGVRLGRILSLPRQLELAMQLCYVPGVLMFTLAVCLTYGRPLAVMVPALLVAVLFLLLVSVRQTVGIERLLRPLAVEELLRHPDARPSGSGFFWPRQVWYRPYFSLVVMLATLVALAVVLVRRARSVLAGWEEELWRRGLEPLSGELTTWGRTFAISLAAPSAIILGLVLLLGVISAVAVSRQQRAGVLAVEEAARALASGAYELPAWPVTDELGDLAYSTTVAVGAMQRKADAIAASASTLDDVALELTALMARQQRVVDTQATVLQQTQATAQEIKHISELASEKAGKVLAAAESAEQVGRSGRAAVESSLDQLREILSRVREVAGNVADLEEQTRQIGRISLLMKELADQSNMVALNAAIEAIRAGRSGRTFSIVAQQIRRLGDESVTATGKVQQVLHDVEQAIRQAVRLSGSVIERIGSGLQLTQACGDDIRRLNEIVEANASAARKISATVTRQGTGVAQIVEALIMLGSTMEETVASMRATEAITERARCTAREVAAATGQEARQA